MNNIALTLDAKNELAKLASNIKLARKRRKITFEEMSEKCGASMSTLTRLESGDPTVAIGTIMQVLNVLGLLRGISDIAAPENDVAQVLEEVRNLRLKKKGTRKKVFSEKDLSF